MPRFFVAVILAAFLGASAAAQRVAPDGNYPVYRGGTQVGVSQVSSGGDTINYVDNNDPANDVQITFNTALGVYEGVGGDGIPFQVTFTAHGAGCWSWEKVIAGILVDSGTMGCSSLPPAPLP